MFVGVVAMEMVKGRGFTCGAGQTRGGVCRNAGGGTGTMRGCGQHLCTDHHRRPPHLLNLGNLVSGGSDRRML